MSKKTTFDVQTNHFLKLFFCCFVKLILSAEIHAVLFRASELALTRSTECLGMSVFFRGITETVPSLFRGITKSIFRYQSFAKLSCVSVGQW
jgi:hypothetical protein